MGTGGGVPLCGRGGGSGSPPGGLLAGRGVAEGHPMKFKDVFFVRVKTHLLGRFARRGVRERSREA